MKKNLVSGIFILILLCSATFALAEQNPLKQLTGHVWMASSEENKQALIFGVECAVSMEYAMAEHKAQKNDSPTDEKSIIYNLSPFSKNWILAFENVDRSQIVNEIDAWFTTHSQDKDAFVFQILWKNIMQPKLIAR